MTVEDTARGPQLLCVFFYSVQAQSRESSLINQLRSTPSVVCSFVGMAQPKRLRAVAQVGDGVNFLFFFELAPRCSCFDWISTPIFRLLADGVNVWIVKAKIDACWIAWGLLSSDGNLSLWCFCQQVPWTTRVQSSVAACLLWKPALTPVYAPPLDLALYLVGQSFFIAK